MNTEKRSWLWIDWFIFSLRASWYIIGVVYYFVNQADLEGLPFSFFALLVTASFVVPNLFWRPGYINRQLYALSELAVTGFFTVYTNIFLTLNFGSVFLLLPAFMIGYLASRQTSAWTFPVFLLILPGARYWSAESFTIFIVQYIDVFVFFAFGACLNVIVRSHIKREQLLEENTAQSNFIQEQNKILEQYAVKVEQLTLLEERNRLAKELHDSIGHHFTSITVGLDAIRYMLELEPEMAKTKVEGLAELSRKGLDEIRKSIHSIAPSEEDMPLSSQLEQIALEFAAHTGTFIQFQCFGEECPVSQQTKLTFIRCMQEAITNAKRHGHATEIKAFLTFRTDSIELVIENNGHTFIAGDLGFGLNAMKDRLEQLQGRLEITNNSTGQFSLICTVPVRRNV
ncbi:sensor histidine kinase [Bacillus sp. M6-12]|uniref:sensor histidine kinase n=1 Tax=Bacillus sp. M6-12 TaxID=2054166 RepID=UPI0015E127E8|nr:sensor histidine kinase [Bacillus sp. M6-12]